MQPKLELTKNGNYFSPDDPGEVDGKGLRGAKRRSVTEEEAEILSKLVHGLIVLEVGTGLGVSTKALAKTAFSVTTVDIDPWVNKFILPDNVERLLAIPNRYYHIAFIDGSHKFEDVMEDIIQTKAPSLIMHDCCLDGVAEAIAACKLILVEDYETRCSMKLYKR